MKIPQSFELMGETITVEYSTTLMLQGDSVGRACFETNTIQLQENSKVFPRTKEQIRQTFLHEVIHFILIGMKQTDLNKNENFVDTFANLLLQFEKSAKGEVK